VRRNCSLYASLISTVLLLGACAAEQEPSAVGATVSKEELTVIMGTQGAVQLASEYIAADQGYWEKEGLNVTITETESGATTAIAAVVSGSAFSACTGIASAASAIEQGAPIKLLTLAALGSTSVLVGSKAFLESKGYQENWSVKQKLEMLEGSTMGMFAPGDSTQKTSIFLLKHHDVDSNAVEFLALRNQSGALAGMQQNSIAAMSAPRELVGQIEALGVGRTIVDYEKDIPFFDTFPGLVCVVSDGSIEREPETVEAFVRGLAAATAFVKANGDQTKELLLDLPGFKPEAVEAAFTAMQRQTPTNLAITTDHYDAFLTFQETIGSPVSVPYEDAVESAIVVKAQDSK